MDLLQPSPKDAGAHLFCYTPTRAMRDITFMSRPLIFSRYFPFRVAGKVCTGSAQWTSKCSPESSSSRCLGWKQICAPAELVGRGISAFLAENLEESKGNPYLDFQDCRHMVPWGELAVSKTYMARAGRILSMGTNLQAVMSQAQVRQMLAKTFQTATEPA